MPVRTTVARSRQPLVGGGSGVLDIVTGVYHNYHNFSSSLDVHVNTTQLTSSVMQNAMLVEYPAL
jgi:hypothetical protein